jgi:hypothetical protein
LLIVPSLGQLTPSTVRAKNQRRLPRINKQQVSPLRRWNAR